MPAEREATPVMQALYHEEMAKAGAPGILGRPWREASWRPPLLVHGSPWQKETYIEKILSGRTSSSAQGVQRA